MSRFPKRNNRHKTDLYETPRPLVERIVQWVKTRIQPPTTILEPGSSSKAPFLVAAKNVWYTSNLVLLGVEYLSDNGFVREPNCPVIFDTDYLSWDNGKRWDLIITNPPFSLALPFLEHSRTLLAPGGKIVFLLRLAWTEGRKRYKILHSKWVPEKIAVIPDRPSFTNDGRTDATAYGIFMYGEFTGTASLLEWLPY